MNQTSAWGTAVDRPEVRSSDGYWRWAEPTEERSRTVLEQQQRPVRAGKRHGPGRYRTGNRLFFYTLFYFALAASVEVWWLNPPFGSLFRPRVGLLAAG